MRPVFVPAWTALSHWRDRPTSLVGRPSETPATEEAAMSGPASNPVGVFALANLLLFFVCLVAFPPGAVVFALLGAGVAVWSRFFRVRHSQQGVLRTHHATSAR